MAGDDQKNGTKHLFQHNSEKHIRDAHLWFSVFMRPERSRFTRAQRVSASMALLCLAMLTNAMWYMLISPLLK